MKRKMVSSKAAVILLSTAIVMGSVPTPYVFADETEAEKVATSEQVTEAGEVSSKNLGAEAPAPAAEAPAEEPASAPASEASAETVAEAPAPVSTPLASEVETDPPAPEPEPAPETSAPEPETAPPAPEPEPAPAPEPEPAPAPATEQAADTSEPTPAPEPKSTEAQPLPENHSTAVPENPTEQRIDQPIEDADMADAFLVRVDGGEAIQFQKNHSLRNIVDILTGTNSSDLAQEDQFFMDLVDEKTAMRLPLELDSEDTTQNLYKIVNSQDDQEAVIVVYCKDGESGRFTMKTSEDGGPKTITFDKKDAGDTFTVDYDANEGSMGYAIGSVRAKGEPYSHFDAMPTRDGYQFYGWYDGKGDDARRVNLTDAVDDDITLYAHWTVGETAVVTYDFGFAFDDDEDGEIAVAYAVKDDGTYDIDGLPVPKKNGEKLHGWMDEAGNPVDGKGLSGDKTLFAAWFEDDYNEDAFDGDEPVLDNPEEEASDENAEGGTETEAPAEEVSVEEPAGSDETSSTEEPAQTPAEAPAEEDAPALETEAPAPVETEAPTVDENGRSLIISDTNVADDTDVMTVGSGPSLLSSEDFDEFELRSSTLGGNPDWGTDRDPVPVTTVKFNNPRQTIDKAETGINFAYTYGPEYADDADFVWSSSDTNVLRIDANGKYYSYGPGAAREGTKTVTVTIQAKSNPDVKADCIITITEKIENTPDRELEQEDTTYVVSFDSDGGSEIPSQTVGVNTSVSVSGIRPVKNGFVFEGWYLADGTRVTSITPTADVTLYARWIEGEAAEMVEITYEPQNGMAATVVDVEKGSVVTFPAVSYDGHTFLGWFSAANGGERIANGTVLMDNATFYAQWSDDSIAGTYALTLDPNGGRINGFSGVILADNPLIKNQTSNSSIAAYDPERQNFTFIGWYDAPTGGEKVYDTAGHYVNGSYWDNGQYIGDKNLTVYAHWSQNPETFELTFDARGGNNIPPQRYDIGSVVTAFPRATRPGYWFLGWYDLPTAGNFLTSVTMDTDKVIYAQWLKIEEEESIKTYTVTFDEQGGSEVTDVTVNEGTKVALPTTTRSGYEFTGWYSAPEGGTRLLSLTVDHDQTLYAHWKSPSSQAKTFIITFDFQTGTIETVICYTEDDGTIREVTSFPEASRTDYTFDGWFTEPVNGAKVEKYAGDTDVTFYAHWTGTKPPETKQWTITFEEQGGAEVEDMLVDDGADVMLPDISREGGYVFDGWYTEPTGGTHLASLKATSNMTVYAHWTKTADVERTITITFDTQNGTIQNVTANVYKDGTVDTVSNFPTPVKDGATFLGWYTAKTGGVKVTSYSGNTDITFYAHWQEGEPTPEPDTFTITFDANGGSSVNSMNAKAGTTVSALPQAARDGYNFLGWFTDKDGGSKVTELTVTGDVTLYAHWEEQTEPVTKTYTLSFDSNGGDPVAAVEAEEGQRIDTFPVAVREGYDFLGWYTKAEGGNKVKAVTMKSDVTLHAHWKETSPVTTQFTITLDDQNGNKKEITADAGEKVSDFGEPAKREGYTFLGWYTKSEGGNKVISYSGPDDITFYAHWQKDGSDEPETPAKVKSLTLNTHEITVTVDDPLGLSYKYSPKNAVNAEFTWTSSNTAVITTNGTPFRYTGEAGDTTLTISTKDGSVSDSCLVHVKKKESDTPVVPDNTVVPDNGSNVTPTPTTEETQTPATIEKYVLTVVSSTGTTQKVTVNSDVQLDALARKLGYEVSAYALKTATVAEHGISKTITMKELAEMGKNGDLLIIAYNKAGQAIGSAKIAKTGDATFTVTLSKDTNQSLSTYANGTSTDTSVSGKGKEEVAKEGKKDTAAQPQKTADTATLPLFGGLAGLATILLAFLAIFRRKLRFDR